MINVGEYYTALARQFNQPESSERFSADFLLAVNRTIGDINANCKGLDTISRIDDLEGEIGIDASLEGAFTDGVIYHLTKQGQPFGVDSQINVRDARATWDVSMAAFVTQAILALDSASEDVAGLGYIDDSNDDAETDV